MLRFPATAVMLLAFISSVAREAIAADAPPAATKAPELKLAPNETAIYVSDMHCSTCAKKISGKLFRLKGVVKVRTDVKKHLAVVTPQAKKQVDAKAAWAAVQKAGFEPTKDA